MAITVDRLEGFAALAGEVWRADMLGVGLGDVLSALGVFVVFVLIRGLFTRYVIGRLRRWATRTGNALDNAAVAALEPPLRFAPIVMAAYFVKEILPFEGGAATVTTDVVRSLLAFVLFWTFYGLVEAMRGLTPRIAAVLTDELVEWLIRGLKIASVFLGAVSILEIWGIEVAPILAGLGIIGIAVALGAQDLFRNLIAGILILGERRFARGDWITVEGVVDGTVEAIGFRSTRVRLFDMAPTYVPNARLSDNPLINHTRMTHWRISWMIALEYGATIEQLRRIREEIEAFLTDDGAFAQPPRAPLFVRIDRFSDSSIDILVYCFTTTTVWGEWLAEKERLAYRIKEIVEGAGGAFAFPSRTVRVLAEGAEPFAPPQAPGAVGDAPRRRAPDPGTKKP